MLPSADDLAALAEAAATAWGARTRFSSFGNLHVESEAADLDATRTEAGAQPFSGTIEAERAEAAALLEALSDTLLARRIAHRLELYEGGDEIARYEYEWPEEDA
jgi:hypothetical protein